MSDQLKWDRDFLALADFWGQRKSKDPSTKVGAVIARGKDLLSLGYNGFPPGVEDTPERLNDRATKYALIVHGEINAILHAGDVHGCTLYTTPFAPCSDCAKIVIASGIKRVVAPTATPDQLARWGDSFKKMESMFAEAGVTLEYID